MASKEVAEADVDKLATFLENGTSLIGKGQSESAANLSRASDHVLMESLTAVQESLNLLSTKTGQALPDGLGTKLTKCKQVIDSVNLITYKQERRDAGGFDTSQELICELYDFTDGEYTETKFKLSDAKNLPSFNGTEDNTAAYYESFMHAVSNHGKASKLNSKG